MHVSRIQADASPQSSHPRDQATHVWQVLAQVVEMLRLLAGAKPPTDSEGFELLQLEALAEAAAHDASAMPSVGDAKVGGTCSWFLCAAFLSSWPNSHHHQ